MKIIATIFILFLLSPFNSNSQGVLDIFKGAKDRVNNAINNEVENAKNKAAEKAAKKAEELKNRALDKAEKAKQAAIDKANKAKEKALAKANKIVDNTDQNISNKVNNIIDNKSNTNSNNVENGNPISNSNTENNNQISNTTKSENKPIRRVVEIDSLLRYSNEIPDTAFSNKFPFLINLFKNEKQKDTAIKKVYFIHNKYLGGGNVVYKKRGLFFINESSMLRNKNEIECNTINSFYYFIGILHAQNTGLYNSNDTNINIKKQVYVWKFVLNKCLGLGTGCYPLKTAINDVKRGKVNSISYFGKEACSQIFATPLFNDFEKYANSCVDADKPKELFNLKD